jgi:hypothetical protein
VTIKGKDSNGLDTQFTVADAVKSLLAQKPYLAKATGRSGGETGSGTPPAGGNVGDDLTTLNMQYQNKMMAGDRKGAQEIKKKLEAHFSNNMISRSI